MNWIVDENIGTRKKRHGKGTEPNWKPRAYFSNHWHALRFMIMHEIKCTKGEFSPDALKVLYEGLAHLEDLITAYEERTKEALKSVPDGAKAWSPQNMHHPTAANENAVAKKNQKL